MSPVAKILRMSQLFFRLLAASWRLPALLKTVLPSTRWPRFAETPAAVYAPWALVLKTSQNTVCQRGSAKIDLMSRAFWQVAALPKRPRNRCSRLRAGPGWPETPSAVYAKLRIGAPVYAPRGGLEKRRNVSRSGPGFGGPGASGDGSQDSLNMSLVAALRSRIPSMSRILGLVAQNP